MPRASRAAALIAGTAFMAGWAYRALVPKVACPKCGSPKWRRLGGGLKQCSACSWKFFMQLPDPKGPSS
jgi:ribosomal protein L37AE/L43A